jgi:hypothetical protein
MTEERDQCAPSTGPIPTDAPMRELIFRWRTPSEFRELADAAVKYYGVDDSAAYSCKATPINSAR